MDNSKECKFKVGDVVVCTEKDSDALESNFLAHGQSYLVSRIDAYDKFEDSFLLRVENIETQKTTYAYEYRFNQKKETSLTAESLRNSIISLQQERVSLQEQVEQNIAQEKSLTEQLKELGFLLVESKEQPTNVVDEKKSVLYAEDIEEDMTDSRNWKVGDIIVATSHGYNNRLGVGYRVTKVGETTHYECLDARFTKKEYMDKSDHGWLSSNYKFHSRPITN